ncbi:unnamed protein product [Protopolystoma xenopodis]|uniref:Uncharacterized protein n=1 Tax=Protopolystoma xenopodis TaxID=117903 RepID=A0A3S5AEZ6_9PLAT|nr:unnamed protein product [Protopolystoma xenopodis]
MDSCFEKQPASQEKNVMPSLHFFESIYPLTTTASSLRNSSAKSKSHLTDGYPTDGEAVDRKSQSKLRAPYAISRKSYIVEERLSQTNAQTVNTMKHADAKPQSHSYFANNMHSGVNLIGKSPEKRITPKNIHFQSPTIQHDYDKNAAENRLDLVLSGNKAENGCYEERAQEKKDIKQENKEFSINRVKSVIRIFSEKADDAIPRCYGSGLKQAKRLEQKCQPLLSKSSHVSPSIQHRQSRDFVHLHPKLDCSQEDQPTKIIARQQMPWQQLKIDNTINISNSFITDFRQPMRSKLTDNNSPEEKSNNFSKVDCVDTQGILKDTALSMDAIKCDIPIKRINIIATSDSILDGASSTASSKSSKYRAINSSIKLPVTMPKDDEAICQLSKAEPINLVHSASQYSCFLTSHLSHTLPQEREKGQTDKCNLQEIGCKASLINHLNSHSTILDVITTCASNRSPRMETEERINCIREPYRDGKISSRFGFVGGLRKAHVSPLTLRSDNDTGRYEKKEAFLDPISSDLETNASHVPGIFNEAIIKRKVPKNQRSNVTQIETSVSFKLTPSKICEQKRCVVVTRISKPDGSTMFTTAPLCDSQSSDAKNSVYMAKIECEGCKPISKYKKVVNFSKSKTNSQESESKCMHVRTTQTIFHR